MFAMLVCLPHGTLYNQRQHSHVMNLHNNDATVAKAKGFRKPEKNGRKNEEKDQLCKSQLE